MTKAVPVEKSVGMVIPHDITEIRKDSSEKYGKGFKGAAFKKGHVIREKDIEHLKRIGKEHIFVLELGEEDIHEDESALKLAAALKGDGVKLSGEPIEGKISLLAERDGLLKIDKKALYEFNMLGEVMCATLHENICVKQGEQIAATRLIPLIGNRNIVDSAVQICEEAGGIINVCPIRKIKAGLVITGNEVFSGKIKDAFEPVLREKLAQFNSTVSDVRFAPDDIKQIAEEIKYCIKQGAELIITSGGMSVDPDDVTRAGIKEAGARDIVYGTPVLPGAMFLAGVIDEVPVLGLPACGMFHKITVFDLILPRILAREKITRQDLAELGHGGLCKICKNCQFPDCSFGK
jgi:molybdenum cofactor synthesis domain-containing protein